MLSYIDKNIKAYIFCIKIFITLEMTMINSFILIFQFFRMKMILGK